MNNITRSALFDETPAGGGGGGGGNNNPPPGGHYDFRPHLPEDIRTDPVFDPLKPKDQAETIALLGKGYREAQKMVGTNRLPVPQKDWKPEDWAKFNRALGVPEKFEDYKTPEVKLTQGLEIIPEKMGAWKKVFHEAGLRPDQVEKIMTTYLTEVNGTFSQNQEAGQQKAREGETLLRETFGDKYDANLDIARSVLKKFGTEELVGELSESGFGNNPRLTIFLAKLGAGMMDDGAAGGGDGLPVGARTQALQQIESLKLDVAFQKALNTREDPGHKAAVEKWLALHKQSTGPAQ